MDVADGTIGEVVVDNKVHSFKVDASPHQLRTDENPDLPQPETCYDIVSLYHQAVYLSAEECYERYRTVL